MSDVPTENYQDTLQEHFYLFSKFLVAEDFLEQLISDEVLTLDDKEVICNRVVHQNRRQRTNKLIEILTTRGERGYEKFLEILEFQYPHVYKTITKKEPRDPPLDFHRNRSSDRLRMIHELPNLLEHMKAQCVANTELDSQLSVLQQLLHVSKDENQALEKEVEQLKDVRQENMDLRITLKTMELKYHENQVAISEWSQKSYQLLESVNEYKEKCHNLQVKYDSIVRSKSSSSNSTENIVEAPTIPVEHHQVKVTPALPICSVDNAPHYKARLEILQHEVESQIQQCQDMSNRLQRSEDAYQNLEDENKKLKKELKKITQEKNTFETQCMDYTVKHESYYKTIQKKNDEILKLQHKRVEEQRHVTELNHEKNELFEKNHRLEEQIQALKTDNEKIKARLSTGSRSSQELTGSSMDQSNGSSTSDGELLEDAPIVNRKIQRRKVVKKSNSGEKYADRLASLDRDYSPHSMDMCSIGDGDNDVSYKCSTLPSLASDTAELMFRREVAHFRYSKRNSISRNTETSSIRAHYGSHIERDPGSEFVKHNMRGGERVSNLSLDSSKTRVASSHPADCNDDVSVSEKSSVYVSRSPRSTVNSTRLSRQEATLNDPTCSSPVRELEINQGEDASIKRADLSAAQTRGRDKGKSSGIPTGGKKYTRAGRRNTDSSQDLEGPAQCDSIIDKSDLSDEGSPFSSDFSSHDVHTVLLAKDRLVLID